MGTFHEKTSTIKDRYSKELRETETTKKFLRTHGYFFYT